jgi:hypothetical protein
MGSFLYYLFQDAACSIRGIARLDLLQRLVHFFIGKADFTFIGLVSP